MAGFGMNLGASRRKSMFRQDGGVRSGTRQQSGVAQPNLLDDVMKDNWSEPLASGGGGFSLSAGVDGDTDPYKEAMSSAPKDGVEGPPEAPHDPYKGVGQQPGDKPGVLGGGSMGLTPDRTKSGDLQKQYDAVLAKRSPIMAGFRGMPQVYAAADAKWQQRIEMARRQEDEEAAQARAAATWVDSKGVLESGQMLEENPYTQAMRPKTAPEQYKEEMEGPTQPGAEAPYREAMRQAPVYAPQFPERRLIGVQEEKGDIRDTTNKREEDAAKTAAEKAADIEKARVVGEEQRKTAQVYGANSMAVTKAGIEAGRYEPKTQPQDPYATPQGESAEAGLYNKLALRAAGVMTPEAFDALDDAKKTAAFAQADAEMKKRTEQRGERRVPRAAGPGAPLEKSGGYKVGDRKQTTYQGRPVTVEWTTAGKWKIVAEGAGKK